MYRFEKKENFSIYIFNDMNLKIKAIDNGLLKNVYINYKGYNPLFTMLLGNFELECEMDSIKFDVDKTDGNNTMFCIVDREYIDAFVKEVYCFIVENKVERMLNKQDKSDWNY